jgi:hypothetical protein
MIVPLPGQTQARRHLAIPLPWIAHGIAHFGLAKRPAALGRFSLDVLNLGYPPSPANSLDPYLHSKPLLMMWRGKNIASVSDFKIAIFNLR